MIDTTHAINYLQEVVEQLKAKEARLIEDDNFMQKKKDMIVLERSELTTSKSAFLEKVDGYGKEVERVTKMRSLARKMKAQVDEDRDELKIEMKKLEKRKEQVIDLEAKQKELEKRDQLLEVKESDIEERELLVEKEKKANRTKQEDLDLRAKSIKKKQEQLQKMIDAQKI